MTLKLTRGIHMARHARFRERDLQYAQGGSITSNGSIKKNIVGFSGPCDHEECYDGVNTTKPFLDGDLSVRRWRIKEPVVLNGSAYYNRFYGTITANAYYSNTADSAASFRNSLPIINANWDYWRTKALANLNYRKPAVDLPLFLFELKDFPRMLFDIGRYAATVKSGGTWGEMLYGAFGNKVDYADIPGAFLSYRFAWAPLLGDMLSLLHVADLAAKRLKFLNNLERSRPVRRKLASHRVVSETVEDAPEARIYCDSIALYTADQRTDAIEDVWFTARTAPKDPFPASLTERQDLARALALGLSNRWDFYWEILPFSWAIDYLINFGDVIQARQALCLMEIKDLNVMRRVRLVRTHTNTWTRDGFSATPYTALFEGKYRDYTMNPSPMLARRPIMTGMMMTTLGALGLATVLRGRTDRLWWR